MSLDERATPGTASAAHADPASGTEVSVTPELRSLYDQYFGDGGDLEFWEICGIPKAANCMQMCRNVPHRTLLDIGAGVGSLSNRFGQTGFAQQITAVDISASGLEILRKRNIPNLVEVKPFDGYRIPFPDQSFDLGVLSHVVEHLEEPRRLLREAARVCRHLYVEVPLEFNLLARHIRKDFVMDSVGHINFYDRKLIRLLVQTTGLVVLDQQLFHTTWDAYRILGGSKLSYQVKKLALRLSPRLAGKLFTYHCGLLIRGSMGAPSGG